MAKKPDQQNIDKNASANPLVGKSAKANIRSSGKSAINVFLKQAEKIKSPGDGQGRLIFALDATMSRQPTWDVACEIQSEMFSAAGNTGGLAIQLVYFRGFGECRASKWVVRSNALRDLMIGITCKGGRTQICKVLTHAKNEVSKTKPGDKVSALVFVGDAMEEAIDELSHRAGELGLLGVPAFMFQEGHDSVTERAFREVAKLSGGAYMRFDTGSAAELGQLLRAVAKYASGGLKAIASDRNKSVQALLQQLK
jgi:hypothetical protein